MANFLKNKAKVLFIAYAILFFVIILFSLYYSTNYSDIHVFYKITESGEVSFGRTNSFNTFDVDNEYIYTYFGGELTGEGETIEGYATDGPFATAIANNIASNKKNKEKNDFFYLGGYENVVYKFQKDLAATNTFIVIYGLVGLICFAMLLIFSNHSRKVYYKSNLVIGILSPLVAIVMSVLVIIKNLNLMMVLNKNLALFKVTAVLQDVKIADKTKVGLIKGDYATLISYADNVNVTTFIVLLALVGIAIAYSVFLMVYTVYRYKECSEKRAQIIERAVKNND